MTKKRTRPRTNHETAPHKTAFKIILAIHIIIARMRHTHGVFMWIVRGRRIELLASSMSTKRSTTELTARNLKSISILTDLLFYAKNIVLAQFCFFEKGLG